MPENTTTIRPQTSDANRFAVRDRLTELIDAAVQANDSEEGPDAQATAEAIMSEFHVEAAKFATGGVLRGVGVLPVAEPAGRSVHYSEGSVAFDPR